MDDLRDVVLADLPAPLVKVSDNTASHVFDASPADNLVLRVLSPSRSGLVPSRDYLRGVTPGAAVLAALDRSVAALTEQYGANPVAWRAPHPRSKIASLTGVIGPSTTMPYQDRGSWIHVVAFTDRVNPVAGAPFGGSRPVAVGPGQQAHLGPDRGDRLPATGASALPALAGLVLLALWAVRRRRPNAAG